jgi:hypothetical protein
MLWLVLAFMAFVLALTIYRLRSGGPGPAVNWLPRSLRSRTNKVYDKHGWQQPYDEDGIRNTDRSAV